jgi:hypothetical protein
MFDLEAAWPGKGSLFCLWLCSECGAPYYFRKKEGGKKHGRPPAEPMTGYVPIATLQHEYVGFVGPCWRAHQYGVKCATPRGGRILYHEGYSPPPAELIAEITRIAREHRKDQEKALTAARKAATV